jgi:hypothetical protein
MSQERRASFVVGYVFIASLKDLWRYIKISTI